MMVMAARVVVIQHNDGEQSGDEFDIPPTREGETATETLARKATSHEDHGWTIEFTSDGFHAWKEYPGRPVERKDRYFRLID
jgi:hypothetical protein